MARKTFAEIDAGRRRYDPAVEGFGSPDQWLEAFRVRMDLKEAQEVVGSRTPRGILGVTLTATWQDIKNAYRRMMLAYHPDRIATSKIPLEEATRRTREINAAFAILANEFKK